MVAAYWWPAAALYNLGTGGWLAWANDTAAQLHYPRSPTTGPAVQTADIPQTATLALTFYPVAYTKIATTYSPNAGVGGLKWAARKWAARNRDHFSWWWRDRRSRARRWRREAPYSLRSAEGLGSEEGRRSPSQKFSEKLTSKSRIFLIFFASWNGLISCWQVTIILLQFVLPPRTTRTQLTATYPTGHKMGF